MPCARHRRHACRGDRAKPVQHGREVVEGVVAHPLRLWLARRYATKKPVRQDLVARRAKTLRTLQTPTDEVPGVRYSLLSLVPRVKIALQLRRAQNWSHIVIADDQPGAQSRLIHVIDKFIVRNVLAEQGLA